MGKTFDLAGAGQLHDERVKRLAPMYSQPDVSECIALTLRNPAIAPAIRKAIEAELAKLPGGGRGLDAPLYPQAEPTAKAV